MADRQIYRQTDGMMDRRNDKHLKSSIAPLFLSGAINSVNRQLHRLYSPMANDFI